MFLFLFVLFILWDYYRTKNEYFADYVDRWGIPEGVVELSAEQVKKRSTHYRFEYTHRSILGKGKGTLKRVVFANSPDFVNVSPKNHLQIMGRYVDVVS